MNTTQRFLITSATSLLLAASVQAQTWEWTGPGGTTTAPTAGNWFTATAGEHWFQVDDPVSLNTTFLTFRSGTGAYTATNNFGTSPQFILNRIDYFQGGGTSDVTVAGNALNFSGTTPSIFYNGNGGLFTVTAPINATGTTLTLGRTNTTVALGNNNNFVINPGNANITANEVIIAGGDEKGGRVNLRGTQNNIGKITVGANGHFYVSSTFSSTAPLHFSSATSLATRFANQGFTVGGLHSDTAGAGRITQDGTTGSGFFTINVAADQSYDFSGIIGNGDGVITNAGNNRTRLIKNGAGTQVISGTMAGGSQNADLITVNAGLLHFSAGSTITSPSDNNSERILVNNGGHFRMDGTIQNSLGLLQVNAGGTLSGSGSINRPTVVSGTHNPGTSPGVQTFVQNLTYNNGSTINWELIGNTDAGRGTNFDGINVGGNLIINDVSTINLVFNDTGSNVDWTDAFWGQNRSWLFYELTGATSSRTGIFTLGTVGLDSLGAALTDVRSDAFFSLTHESNGDVFVSYVIPEPGTLALVGIAFGAALLSLRRRK